MDNGWRWSKLFKTLAGGDRAHDEQEEKAVQAETLR